MPYGLSDLSGVQPVVGDMPYDPSEDLSLQPPNLLPPVPQLAPPGLGQQFLQNFAGAESVQPNPRNFGEGLLSGLTSGLGAAGQRAVAQRQRLEAMQQQQQMLTNQMNLQATRAYQNAKAKQSLSADEFNRTHIPLTADMQAKNPELANIPAGTMITPDLAKSKAAGEAGGETERFMRLSPEDQAKFLHSKGQIAAAGESPEAKMSPEDIKLLVNMTLVGNGLQYNAFGRSKEGQANRKLYTQMLHEEMQKQGISEGDLTTRQALLPADKASLGKMIGQKDQIEQYVNTLHDNSDLLLNLAAKIPDVGTRFMNKPFRDAMSQLGDKDQAAFSGALSSVQSEAARILRSGPTLNTPLTDSARNEMNHVISGDYTYGQLQGAIDTIKKESSNRLNEQQRQIDQITGRISGRGATPAAVQGFNPKPGGFFDSNRPGGR